jgi:hypothetical protein
LPGELRTLDLSSKTFDEFVEFIFARTIVSDKDQYDYFLADLDGRQYGEAAPSSPEILVGYMTKLFSEFGQIAPRYSLVQIDQGIWGILGENLRLYEFLFDNSVPLPNRLDAIRSIYFVYCDFVAKLKTDPDPNLGGFFMWWDLILHGFWVFFTPLVAGTYTYDASKMNDASKLDSEPRVVLDVMFETLKRILNLAHGEAQRCALHGLGHLHHPAVHDAVQRYIDANKSELPLEWLQECRDGTVL